MFFFFVFFLAYFDLNLLSFVWLTHRQGVCSLIPFKTHPLPSVFRNLMTICLGMHFFRHAMFGVYSVPGILRFRCFVRIGGGSYAIVLFLRFLLVPYSSFRHTDGQNARSYVPLLRYLSSVHVFRSLPSLSLWLDSLFCSIFRFPATFILLLSSPSSFFYFSYYLTKF